MLGFCVGVAVGGRGEVDAEEEKCCTGAVDSVDSDCDDIGSVFCLFDDEMGDERGTFVCSFD